jgi:hypothetical protein
MTAPIPDGLQWERLADALLPRAEHWAAHVDGKVYVIGGYVIASPLWAYTPAGLPASGAPIPTETVEVYDVARDSWSLGVAYPGPVDHHPTAVHDGVIYVFKEPTGGDGSYYKFDPAVGAWQPFAPAPHSHSAGTAAVIGDKIYVVGNVQETDVYDPIADTWQTIEGDAALMPTRRGHTSGAAVDGRFYVAGGDVGGHSENTEANEEFDPATGAWTARAPLPVVRGSTAGVAWVDRVVLLGGQSGDDGSPAYANADAYDPRVDAWTALPPMPVGRHGAAVVVVDDAIFVFAGAPLQGITGFAQTHVLRASPAP